jgi:CheY-like chemotaxis protein
MNQVEAASIMIIGEDSHFDYLMRSYVHRSGHSILFSHPRDSVLEIIQRGQPAVIILDVDLPGMSGWNLLRTLKSNQVTAKIPVVICSWLDEQERGTQAGADVYLRMPILYGDFLEALNNVGIQVDLNTV